MWLLQKVTSEENRLYLVSEKKNYTVGRMSGDIVLPEDASISRKHCSIKIAKRSECPFSVKTLTGVWLVDEGSKYGTFVQNNNQWQKIERNQNKNLLHGAVIKFGLMENIWRLEYKPLIACTSGITNDQKEWMKKMLVTLDGELISKWMKQCSILFVNEITLTVKVILALINGVPIVKTNYLQKLAESVKKHQEWPKYEDYRPEIAETTLEKNQVSLKITDTRKELFKGKKFIIPTEKQMNTIGDIVTSAGGTAEILDFEKCDWLGEKNTILIQFPLNTTDSLSKKFKELAGKLESDYQRRVIPDSEVAQAVAYSSIDKYCNPENRNFGVRMSKSSLSLGDIIVEETPIETMSGDYDMFTIGGSSVNDTPHSASGFLTEPMQKKRSHSPEGSVISKKTAVVDEKGKTVGIKKSLVPECGPSKAKFDSDRNIEKNRFIQNFNPEPSTSKGAASSPEALAAEDDLDPFWTLSESKSSNQVKRKIENDRFKEVTDAPMEKRRRCDVVNEMKETKRSYVLKSSEPTQPSATTNKNDSVEKFSSADHSSKLEENSKKHIDMDDTGYIDVDKGRIKKSEIDPLNSTIILLSLVTLAHKQANTENKTGIRNVKMFKKQKVFTTGEKVLTDPPPRNSAFLDQEGWIDTSKKSSSKLSELNEF